MKKFIAIILSLVLALSMTACGSSAPAETQAPEAAGAATELKIAIPQHVNVIDYEDMKDEGDHSITLF